MATAAASGESQKQQSSTEKDFKDSNKPEQHSDEIQHFDTTITKLVERENEDGETETVEVMSDNLYPGEKLKRADDDEKNAAKKKAAQERSREAAKDRGTDK